MIIINFTGGDGDHDGDDGDIVDGEDNREDLMVDRAAVKMKYQPTGNLLV